MDDHIQHDPVYHPRRIPEYQGNPLIEALPIWPEDRKEQLRRLATLPCFDARERRFSVEERIEILKMRLMHYTYMTPGHLRFKRMLDTQLYGGYVPRNPLIPEAQAVLYGAEEDRRRSIGSIQESVRDMPASVSFLTGATGIGKTSLVRAVLRTYGKPIIRHSFYKGRPFPEVQIVNVKVTIPSSHSYKALCRDIVDEVSIALGVPEYTRKLDSRSTGSDFVSEMRRILLQHHVGLIIMDDVQNISEAKSGGKEEILTRILHLREVGIPILMIGTYKARKRLLGEDPRHQSLPRRIIDGFFYDLARPLSAADPDWKAFAEVMWPYQWVQKKPGPLTDQILELLYDLSQGITSLTLALFATAQILAIEAGKEIVDAKAIAAAYDTQVSLFHAKIDALRNKNYDLYEELSYCDDEDESSDAIRNLQAGREAAGGAT